MNNEEREELNFFRHELVKKARWWQWKAETLEKENEKLKSENDALRAGLDKAVELKAKVGDTIYMPWVWNGKSGIAVLEVIYIQIFADKLEYHTDFETDDLAYSAYYKFGKFWVNDFGEIVFTDRKNAEAHLAKLTEGKKDDLD